MCEGNESGNDPGVYTPHGQRRFQFITVSNPPSAKDPTTKTAIRKHVMGEVGKARRLPNRRRKLLTVPLFVPSQGQWACPPSYSNKVDVDETSAPDRHQDLETKRHHSHITCHSPNIVGRADGFHSPQHTEKTGGGIHGPWIPTEALIGKLCWLGAGPLDPFTRYPLQMSRSDHALVAHIFHDPDGSQHAFRDAWYSVGLSDPAAFHLVLSNSAAHLNSARGNGGGWQSAEELLHYDLALQSVNDRIQKSTHEISDSIIGAITGFICHNHIKGSYDQWHIHRKGLTDAINLRGGIGAFDKNKELRLTIMWVDLSGAYSQDINPQFPFPYHLSQPRGRQNESSYSLKAQRSPLNRSCQRLQVNLADLIGSVSQMDAELRSSGAPRSTQRQHQYMPNGDWTNSILHQLLSIRPLRASNPDRSSPAAFIDEACRLGLLLFLAEIRRRCGVQPTRTAVLTEKLAAHLRSRSITFQQRQREPFLWLLMVGAMEAFPSHGSTGYFLQNIRFMRDELHIEGWGALVRILRDVLWSDEVYATRAEAVYVAITAMSD